MVILLSLQAHTKKLFGNCRGNAGFNRFPGNGIFTGWLKVGVQNYTRPDKQQHHLGKRSFPGGKEAEKAIFRQISRRGNRQKPTNL
jgi:hypothetical protein